MSLIAAAVGIFCYHLVYEAAANNAVPVPQHQVTAAARLQPIPLENIGAEVRFTDGTYVVFMEKLCPIPRLSDPSTNSFTAGRVHADRVIYDYGCASRDGDYVKVLWLTEEPMAIPSSSLRQPTGQYYSVKK